VPKSTKCFQYDFSIEIVDANLAILYPRSKIDVLLEILEIHSTCGGPEVDLELFRLAQEMGDNLIWVHGQFFEHVGYFTSLQVSISETRGQFHQHFTRSFCAHRSQKHKRQSSHQLFCAFGIYAHKSCM
jgi:hypothetical protein